MKTLEEFNRIKEFLGGQGITFSPAVVCVSEPEWKDLAYLAREWKLEQDAAEEERRAELDAMTDEEREQRERDAAEEAQRERDELLFHSCGHRPERS